MEMLTQFGYFSNISPTASYLYGLILLVVSVWTAFNVEKPEK